MCRQAVYLIPVLLVWSFYWPVMEFDYVWDDVALFLNNPQLRLASTISDVWGAISVPILPGTTYFRPFVLFTFWVEFKFTGGSPGVSHLVNLGIHSLNIVLLGLLCRELFMIEGSSKRKDYAVALVMAFYGLNPALHEAVCWVSGRFDLLATTFVLASCVFALKAQRERRALNFGLSAVSFGFGLLSKEVAVVTIAVVPLCVWLTDRQFQGGGLGEYRLFFKKYGLLINIFLAGLVIYVCLRGVSMPTLLHVNKDYGSIGSLSHLQLIGRALRFYAVMAVFPFKDMSPQHPHDIESLGWFDIFAIVVFIIILFGLIWKFIGKKVWAGALLFAVIAILPVVHIIPLTIGANIGHERFLTLPMAFLSIALFELVEIVEAKRYSNGIWFVFAMVLLLFMANLRVTVPLWRNELSLWTWAYSQHPTSRFIQHSLVTAALKWQDLQLATRVISKAKEAGASEAMMFLEADLLIKMGRHKEGIALAEKLLASRPRLHNLKKSRSNATAREVENALSKEWYLPAAYVSLAHGYISIKDFQNARVASSAALFYNSQLPPARLMYAYSLWGLGLQREGTLAYLEAFNLYTKPVQPEVAKMTDDYLVQLCREPARDFACKIKIGY